MDEITCAPVLASNLQPVVPSKGRKCRILSLLPTALLISCCNVLLKF